MVVNDKAKGALKRQVSYRETNANEPSTRPRYQISDVKTGILLPSRDEQGSDLFTDLAASGVKVA